MSDITIPSWRARPENPGPNWRMLAVAGGLLGVVAVAGAVGWGVSRMGAPRTVPLIEPDSRPVKIRPESPGGMIVPNQDQLVLEPPSVRRAAERNAGVSARLDQGPELPALEQLRQQAAPPAAPVPNPALAPVIPAAPAPPAASAFNVPVLPAPVAPPPQPAQPPSTQSSSAQPQQQAAVASPAPPTPPAPVVVRPGLAPVANGRAMVQLAALSSEESARSEWERLQKRVPELAAFQSQITRFDRGEGQAPLYRLRAIGLANTAAARSLCEAMRAKAAPCTPLGG